VTAKKDKTMLYVVGGSLIGWLLSVIRQAKTRIVPAGGGHPYAPAKNKGVPFAPGPRGPTWPIHKSSTHKRQHEVPYQDINGNRHGNQARAFRASRGGGDRYHAGIDIYADAGDVIVAPEPGTITGEQNFLNTIAGPDAILFQGDSGTVLLFGEITARSYKDFGLDLGSRVAQGQPIAKVGLTSKGSHMLHIEAYRAGTKTNKRWIASKTPPSELYDITPYLLRALATTGGTIA
jgi:murein DD-endopeptidase MepM/ murein hydrolase activator NlpD